MESLGVALLMIAIISIYAVFYVYSRNIMYNTYSIGDFTLARYIQGIEDGEEVTVQLLVLGSEVDVVNVNGSCAVKTMNNYTDLALANNLSVIEEGRWFLYIIQGKTCKEVEIPEGNKVVLKLVNVRGFVNIQVISHTRF